MSSPSRAIDKKVFIISLPRTGTTSACVFLLEQGLRVAHTAYHQSAFTLAHVIADTPTFIDYALLEERYPRAKFIFIERDFQAWQASMYRLLKSMRKRMRRKPAAFHSEIIRCFQIAFPDFHKPGVLSHSFLAQCYTAHKTQILQHFSSKPEKIAFIRLGEPNAGIKLNTFIFGSMHSSKKANSSMQTIPHVNRARRISYWDSVEHPNKVNSFGSLDEKNRG